MRQHSRTTLLLLFGVIGTLTALSAAADKSQALPPPRWHVSLAPIFGAHPEGTHVTSVGNVILVSHYPEVIAVNRSTGRELWRRNEPADDSVKLPRTSTGRQLLSYGSVDGVGPVVLLLRIRGITIQDRLYNNADDDMVGHWVWPRYVECVDTRGGRTWTFPKDLQFIGVDGVKPIPDPYSTGAMTPCRACGTLLCFGDTVGHNGKFWWYGLDVRDGKVLWKNAIVDEPPVTAECGAGFLVIAYSNPAAGKVNLEWMDGRTGKLKRIGPAPNAAMMSVVGSDLIVVDSAGNLSAYSLATILPAAVRKGD